MSIHAVRERAAGFSNVKSFADITLELVDEVHGFAVSMGGYGVSEAHTGAGERVGGIVNGTILAPGSRASGGGSTMRWRLVSTMSYRRWGGFRKVTEGGSGRWS